MYRKIFLILLAILIGGCATQQIVQDKPEKPEQCFESKVNPHRLNEWKPAQPNPGANLFIFTNPDKDARPQIIVATIHPIYRVIWKYCYLDGKELVLYVFDLQKQCYVVDTTTTPELKIELKKLILKLCKEREA